MLFGHSAIQFNREDCMRGMLRNIGEWEWIDLAKHHGGALTKLLVTKENCNSKFDFFLSSYAPKAYAALHQHEEAEEIFYFIEGEGVFMLDGKRFNIGPGTVVYVPPKTEHGIYNTGFTNLVFVVTASPPEPLWHGDNEQNLPTPGLNDAS